LIKKIFFIGTTLFISLTALSYVYAQNNYHSESTEKELLSDQPDLEILYSQERPPFSIEESSSFVSLEQETLPVGNPELSVSDASQNDSSPEVPPIEKPKEEPDFDIPIVINAKVKQYLQYFQTTIRDRFGIWLARSEKYIPIMKGLLKEHGLPEDLVYMVFIESGFDPYAYSRSKASGLWQFIQWTGKKYGLRVNWWVDERRDPEKSTLAAAKYLKDLYERFECWYLAAAGYNAGEYKIIKAMKRYRTEDFWKLTKYRYLRRETKDYVPQMIAAALIAKDPERYGFSDVEYQEPLQYDKVKVPELTSLFLVAEACETSLDEIKDLNPELRRKVTPPNETGYEVKIPMGKKDLFLKNFEALQPHEAFQFKTHRVRKGDTLSRIARYYRVDLQPLLEINHLKKKSRIRKGMILLIPISMDEKTKPLTMAKKKNGKIQKDKPEKRNLSL
jgi:membrane-bound lytic murein transglycosylase D